MFAKHMTKKLIFLIYKGVTIRDNQYKNGKRYQQKLTKAN